MNHWFRLYNTLVDDPKVQQLPDALFKALVNLWCVASQNDGVLPSADDIGYKLRIKPQRAAEIVTRLVQAGLIDKVDGGFIPHNWDSRQFQSDSSTDRVKKHRDKKKRNVSGNVSETVNETDRAEQSKSETEQSRADAAPPPIDEDLKKKAFALSTTLAVLFTARGWPTPPGERVVHWLQQGYVQGTVFSAIENVLKRGRPISSWEYFDGAIRDAHAKPPMPVSGTAEVVDLSRINWDATVKLWRGNQSIWPRGIGGEPGQYGCKCPANIIAANLIDPSNGRFVSRPLVFISQGSQEMIAHCTEAQISRRQPPKVFEFEEDGILKTGSYVSQSFPDNWDSATGERILPANSEVSAA